MIRGNISTTCATEDDRHTQLFDLAADPFEQDNLAGKNSWSNHLERLRTMLKWWPDRFGDTEEIGRRFWQRYEKHSSNA
jgi:hypothetical protein